MSDQHTSLAELKSIVGEFVAEREWEKFHNPKNLVMSLVIEAAELMEHFQWLKPDEADLAVKPGGPSRPDIADEMADCLSYLLALANVAEVDLSEALVQKMKKNALKYPVETSRGVASPPRNETAGSDDSWSNEPNP